MPQVRFPRIVHQTWKTSEVPDHWAPSHKSWRQFCEHFGFEYKLWTDDDNRKLVETKQPELLEAYDALKYPIMRADFVRPLYMFHYGGLYCDLDIAAKPREMAILWNYYEQSHAQVAIAKSATAGDFGGDENLTNAFMMSVSQHKLWPMYWKGMCTPSHEQPTHVRLLRKIKYFDIIAGTGPHLLNRIVKQYCLQNREHNVLGIPREFISCGFEWDPRPFTTNEAAVVLLKGSSWHSKEMAFFRAGSKAMHYRATILSVVVFFTLAFVVFLLCLLFSMRTTPIRQ